MIHKGLLVILDGWGEAEASTHNAISQADTPHWDKLKQQGHFLTLDASGESVGLPRGQMGNSEVGHMHIGSGQIVQQDLARISECIKNERWTDNKVLLNAFELVKRHNSQLHVLGLCSPGGVHSHEEHLFNLFKLARKHITQPIIAHAFLDGRDVPPKSAKSSLERLEFFADEYHVDVGSICGRYYAMDRDNRWERIQSCYEMLVGKNSEFIAKDSLSALKQAYARGETDEFVQPTSLNHFNPIQKNDVVIFMNFRADRARELSKALTEERFNRFPRGNAPQIHLVTLTQYHDELQADVVFPPQVISNTLGETIAKNSLLQLRIAESEKYAHVTYFLNGGRELPFDNEDRLLIPSPDVATYDQQPEMSAEKVTDELCSSIEKDEYDLYIVNFANADMVGHTGNLQATITAIETLDKCLGRLKDAAVDMHIELLITADHGNAECMFNTETEQPHTSHTQNHVPCLHIGREIKSQSQTGSLIDIAPTILSMMNIEIPEAMDGHPLFEFL